MSKLTDAFGELTQVCRVRPGQFEGDIEAMARRIFRTLNEYPEDVALAALDAWPRQSEWFPAERELRDLLDGIKGDADRKAASQGQANDGAYFQPIGRVAGFVDKVRELYGADYVKSWLSGGINARFTDKLVLVTGSAFDRLQHDCGYLARLWGVQIEKDPRAEELLIKYCNDNDLKFEPKRSRR